MTLFPVTLVLAVSLFFPAIPPAARPTDTDTFARLLSAERHAQGLPIVQPVEAGADVARKAVARLAVTGERPTEIDDALSAWTTVYRAGHGLFDRRTAEVGYWRAGATQVACYRQAPVPTPEVTEGTPIEVVAPVEMRPVAGDQWGFTAYLNSVRARAGLQAVAWDANLAAWATQNSMVGFGHSVRAGRRQNSGIGSLWTVVPMWLASPPHAAVMFDPTITRIGLGVVGSTWTMNAD
jgi:uncharacterized protein YkwD